jgi:membrane associated rhomboid family serine protease
MFVCTGLLVVSMWLNEWKFEPMSSNPTFGPSADVLLALGAKDSNLIVNGGEAYRLVTPMFLHAGVIHYVINMMALNAIGRAVEQSHGSMSSFFMFFIPAVGGTIISAIMLPQYISVGASGGIFGLMGACIADIWLHWSLLFSNIVNGPGGICRHFFVVAILFLDIAVNCLIGLTPFVDNWTRKCVCTPQLFLQMN